MKTLENKTVFITGGSRGIGAAMVKAFAKAGAQVAFSYHSNEAAATVVLDAISEHGKTYKAYQCDVAQVDEINNVIAEVIDTFNGIDVLVNNAGIIKDNLIGAMSMEDWNDVIQTNLTSVFLHTQAVTKSMIAKRNGVLINVSSIVGKMGNAGQSNYAASKAGLIGFTKSMAKELGSRNIRCNAIAPGIIQTEMTEYLMDAVDKKSIPLRRVGLAEDVADVALFLASDSSRYITGQVINVCGGLCI